MSLLSTFSPATLARDRGDAQRQSTVDPLGVVDGLDELIGNGVELARIMRDMVRTAKVGRKGRRRLLTEEEALVNSRTTLRYGPWLRGPRVFPCETRQ
jgi:hypothetical protein